LLKSQAQLLQLRLLALWTSVTAAVVHAKAAVAVQTVVHQEVAHATLVAVVVHAVAQEMVHAQVEDQQVSSLVSHQAVQLETAK
jgi:cytochrome b561